MNGKQLFLFPELDPFKTIIKDVDYVDLSTLTLGDENRKNILGELPKGHFFIYKTGGFNRYLPDLGNVFPFIKNEITGKILSTNLQNTYVRSTITKNMAHGQRIGEKRMGFNLKLHRIAGEAFVVNDNPKLKKIVDHKNKNRIDYRIKNLRWVTFGENNMGVVRVWGKSYEDKLYQDEQGFVGEKSPKT